MTNVVLTLKRHFDMKIKTKIFMQIQLYRKKLSLDKLFSKRQVDFEKLSDHWSFYKEVKRLIVQTKGHNKGHEGIWTFAWL